MNPGAKPIFPALPTGIDRFFREISMRISDLTDDDRVWVKERTELLLGGEFAVSRDEVHDPHKLPGFIATEGNERVGLITYHVNGEDCELVSIDSLCQFMGIGSMLLEKLEEVVLKLCLEIKIEKLVLNSETPPGRASEILFGCMKGFRSRKTLYEIIVQKQVFSIFIKKNISIKSCYFAYQA